MNKTSIEWTDYTAGLIKSTHAGGPVSFNGQEAQRILRTRTTGKRILMKGDPFEEDVPDEMLDRMFAVFALRPDLVFQVLTKRPERMRAYLSEHAAGGRHVWTAAQGITMPGGRTKPSPPWPLPNVWLGVSVEDQAAADERIPALLDTPAAVRFLSCEPLIEEVDLTAWVGYNPSHDSIQGAERGVRLRSREVGRSGNSSGWDNLEGSQGKEDADSRRLPADIQVPDGQGDARRKASISGAPSTGVSPLLRAHSSGADYQPQGWRPDEQQAGQPGAGNVRRTGAAFDTSSRESSERAARRGQRHGETDGQGRAGNSSASSSGRVAQEYRDGLRGQLPSDFEDLPGRPLAALGLVIVGGESGPGARPCDVGWIRDIVQQCRAAGVPVFVKQLGARPVRTVRGSWINGLQRHGPDIQQPYGRAACWACRTEECKLLWPGVPPHVKRWLPLRDRKGGDMSEWPEDLRVREFPS